MSFIIKEPTIFAALQNQDVQMLEQMLNSRQFEIEKKHVSYKSQHFIKATET